MNANLRFIQERLSAARKRVAASDDYKETKVLEKILEELTKTASTPTKTPLFEDPMQSAASVISKHTRKYRTKKVGDKLQIYNIVNDMVKDGNGFVSLDVIIRRLRKEHDIVITTDKSKNANTQLVVYLKNYHRMNPNDNRLILFPRPKIGAKRVKCYTAVALKGKFKNAA